MRIAVLTSSYPRFDGDGSGTFVRSLCTEYVREGHSVEVIAPDDARVSTHDATVPVYCFRSMVKHALAQAEAVCGVSRDLSQRGQAIGATRRPILTIPNGVDTDVFHPHPVEACRLRLRLGIAHDQPVILAVGRLVRKKGF